MPAGMPEPAKARTSSEVKSGLRNLSFSYAEGQGRRARRCSEFSTRSPNFALISLFTTATKPGIEACLIVKLYHENSLFLDIQNSTIST